MTLPRTLLAAAAATAISIGAAQASNGLDAESKNDVMVIDLTVAPVLAEVANAELDRFIERLKRRRDDRTLNERDFRRIRKFERSLG